MRSYKLEVVKAFTDVHTKEKYKVGKKLKVDEERAFELFSSPYHLVKLISCDGDTDLESIQAENAELKAENAELKAENAELKAENERLNEEASNVEDAEPQEETSEKQTKKNK